jgi:hypothetical protein
MTRKTTLLLLISLAFTQVTAQFVSESGDTLYGNEWINFDQDYYKIPVAEDGIYRVSFEELSAAGLPLSNFKGEHLQMFLNGKAYPIYTSTTETFGPGDFIEFYGRKNRGELDEVFYEDPETMQLNPEYSLFTDTAGYFITWNLGSDNLRVKEIEADVSASGLPVEAFYMHKERIVSSNRIHKPTRNGGDNVRYSHFDIGEGFGGNLAKVNEVTIPTSNIFEGGSDPSVDIRFTSNATTHSFDFSINGSVKANWQHSAYVLRNESVSFDVGELKNNNKIRLEGTVDEFDRNILAVVDLNYPREFDFDNENYFEFFMGASGTEKRVEISDFDGGDQALVYDPATGSRIIPEEIDGKYSFIVPISSIDRNIIVYNSQEAHKPVIDIEKIDFVDYSQMDHDYLIISHPRLMEGPVDKVSEYADYRASAAGGSFDPVVVNVEELYEQFTYGVHRHSYSVKNFVNWAKKNWTDPKYVFIIGKGREYAVYRTAAQISDPLNGSFYVPTFGYPGSDNLLNSKGYIKTTHVIPAGRLAAKNIDDVDIYLEKVKEHEAFDQKAQTIEDKLWKKRIMHLAGAETTLQESIGSYLDVMAELVENNQYGARVTTYKKSSTETIQEADADGLLETIDRGLSVLTFFGHSSVGTFDFNIDDVNKLNNRGKYPLVISLGCYSGNIHTASYGISEQYIETRQKGGIAFIASSSTAYVPPQGNFGIRYYDKLGTDYYGQSLGTILTSTLEDSDNITGIHSKILNEQITLHGDPAIILNNAAGPDFVFDYQSFSTEPNVIESNAPEFNVSFNVANLGRVTQDSLDIRLQHINGSGAISNTTNLRIKSPEFDTLLNITIPTNGNTNVGKNTIIGEIDAENKVIEVPNPAAEENNTIVNNQGEDGFAFFAINNSAEPVAPCDFGIYNQEEVILRASTYNALASQKTTYLLEIDTTAEFDSALKLRTEVETFGGLIEWSPELAFEENEVYYWRISPDSISPEIGYKWEAASFIYLPGSPNGWNQSHYYQFLDNEYDGITLEENRIFAFDTSGFFIKIFNSIWDPNTTGYQYNFETYATSVRPWNFMTEGVAIVVGDSITGGAWINNGGDYGSINTSNFGSFRCFGFPTNTAEERAKVTEFLDNIVPEGNFVWFFTILRNFNSDFNPEDWEEDQETLGSDIFTSLEAEGATLVREMSTRGSVPYNFIYQKGKEVLAEDIGEEKQSYITSTAFIPVRRNNGNFSSSLVGPATSWDQIYLSGEVDNVMDSISVNLIGVTLEGTRSVLQTIDYKSEIDISSIDAQAYPYLVINIDAEDSGQYTPLQLQSWRVLYQGLPDLNINVEKDFVFNKDTLFQGEELYLKFNLDNISQYKSDSVEIDIAIIDSNNNTTTFYEKVGTIDDFDSYVYEFRYSTADLFGKYKLSLNINDGENTSEKNYFNNFGVREFVVIGDEKNPILDVTFDGQKILNGDLISSEPIIKISLRDENKYLLLDDPSIVEIALLHPDNSEEIVAQNDPRLRFNPATETSNNEAFFEFSPTLETDGIYTLKVLANDISKNVSGDLLLERSFEVVNKQLISNVLNYPNPFSTSTEFVFTLTGSEIPMELEIEILTVSGKVVKQIFKEELGPLKIGINRTSYKWDGRDEFGNLLANGVYLYRIKAKNQEDAEIENYNLGGVDEFFKNQIGKLVILR